MPRPPRHALGHRAATTRGNRGDSASLAAQGDWRNCRAHHTIVLATARLQTEERGYTPLLLLDEITAHLDKARRTSLFDIILDLGAQAWITGTEDEIFAPLGKQVQHFAVNQGKIEKL